MNRDLKASSFRSPLGFSNGSRGWRPEAGGRGARVPQNLNPTGVEQLLDSKTGIVYSTPTGSIKSATIPNHGFRFTSPAAIIVMTPMGSVSEGGAA